MDMGRLKASTRVMVTMLKIGQLLRKSQHAFFLRAFLRIEKSSLHSKTLDTHFRATLIGHSQLQSTHGPLMLY